jgi:tetratricopeptide (TPR) repeat protein
VQQANLDDAIVQFKAGLALDPDSAHLHYDLGLAYKLKDDLTAAVPQFEQAAKLDPTLPDPAFTLGVIYMQQGRTDEAIARLRQATILAPQNGDAWSLLGSLLKDSGDGPAAADALRHAIALEPEQPSLHIQLAALDAQAGRSADAAAERKIAADLSRAAMNQQRASFALKSGRSLLEQNKLPEALLQLTNAAQADPKLAEPHRLLAEIYTRQGKPADAALERKQAAALTQPSSSADPAKP